MLSFGLRGLEPFPGINSPWLSECLKCGREVSPRLSTLRRGHSGCRSCAGKNSVHKPRISEREALTCLSVANLEPTEPYPGLNEPWRCKCLSCGEAVSPRLLNIRNGHRGCVYCSGRRVSEKVAETRLRESFLTPKNRYPGSVSLPWLTTCSICSKEFRIRLSKLKKGKPACRDCS